jgi:hypothetical protein
MRIPEAIKKSVVLEYDSGLSSVFLSRKYFISHDSVTRFCKQAGVPLRSKRRAHRLSVDGRFFNNIDTEEKAYWLGFICADGNVHGNCIKIMLKESDSQHLEKFKKDIKSSHKVSINTKYGRCSISFRSVEMVKDLKKYGVVDNKSLILSPNLKRIPEFLHRHFWRGIVDGDGYIAKDGSNLCLCGTYDVVSIFSDFIWRLSRPEYLIRQPISNKNHFRINIYGKYVYPILSELYENSTVYLTRKLESAKRYL